MADLKFWVQNIQNLLLLGGLKFDTPSTQNTSWLCHGVSAAIDCNWECTERPNAWSILWYPTASDESRGSPFGDSKLVIGRIWISTQMVSHIWASYPPLLPMFSAHVSSVPFAYESLRIASWAMLRFGDVTQTDGDIPRRRLWPNMRSSK